MKRLFCSGLLSLLLLIFYFPAAPQQARSSAPAQSWYQLDRRDHGYLGISLNKAYSLLEGRSSTTVIVAVIDSGIDTLHEDLRGILWMNPGEIPGNGIDDDGNGYIDDVHGWNFCGSREGENLTNNSYEIARVYHNWKNEFESKKENEIPADRKFLYGQWKKAAAVIDRDYREASETLPRIRDFLSALENSSSVITAHLNISEFGPVHIKLIPQQKNSPLSRAAGLWAEIFSQTTDQTVTNAAVIREISSYRDNLEKKIGRKQLPPEDARGALTGDDYTDINDRFYGNNNLKQHSGDHGTSVAGVIAAVRNNGTGIDGIADDVRIMAIRAVPGGDEHDKDIALAIRYAVDNGARIINMSFGKPVSPYKHMVDDAVRYAASHGVLLVHASGNDGLDLGKEEIYPSPYFLDGGKASNYITVAASGDEKLGGYAASFSNYGRRQVDIFAPGVSIYTTATDNRYRSGDGTSMAAPVVTGVAALLKSYFPRLTPEQIIEILLSSGTTISSEVTVPGKEGKKTKFSGLSSSGKVVNAAEAVRMALQLEGRN